MQDLVRAAIASLVKAVISKTQPAPVEDKSGAQRRNVDGSVVGAVVNVVSANPPLHLHGTLPDLYESSSRARIFLQIEGESFSGFNFGSQTRFSGRTTGGTVLLHEFESGTQHIHA